MTCDISGLQQRSFQLSEFFKKCPVFDRQERTRKLADIWWVYDPHNVLLSFAIKLIL